MKRPNRAIRLCLYHGAALLVLLCLMFFYRCPLYSFFGIPCPGCGISRAHLAALRLDFSGAFGHHPLFFTVVPAILYIAHRNVLKIRLKTKPELAVFGGLLLLFIAVYVYRLLSM